MGNTCSSPCRGRRRRRSRAKDKLDTSDPALLMIREAQQKYFNSHIESDLDESDDDLEDSTDLFDSEASLTNLDSVSVDSELDDSRSANTSRNAIDSASEILRAGATPGTDARGSSGLVSANAANLAIVGAGVPVTAASESQRDSGNGSATHIVTAAETNVTDRVDGGVPSAAGSSSIYAAAATIEKDEDSGVKTGGTNSQPRSGKSARRKPTVNLRDKKRKYISLSKRGNFFSIFNTEDKKARSVDPSKYEYPFENLVFEGGGNKGLAYCGAVRLLEELNIWPQIKRLAGTSAGAMTAALLAVGYNSQDLEHFFSLNLNDIFLDHKFGYLSLIPNLLSSYGWNPGKRIYKWFGHKLAERTGNADITFKDVYSIYKRELCIVATNLNQMTSLYCHPKTTPDMPVRLAVRMSMSIPGMFQAVKHTLHGQTDIFVDGGVLCNYPIHCFDGWWLSMEPENNFLEKLQPLEDIPRLLERTERFGQYNEKTLGMQLYSDNEQDLLKYQLENLRHGVQLQALPNTKLAREKIRKKKLQLKTDREHRRLVKAMNAFLRALRKHNLDKNENIDRHELEAALKDEELFPRRKRLILFGDVGSDIILQYLDRDQNGQISYQELLHFMEETGISMQNRFLGYQRRNINNLPSFLDTLQATLLTNVKRVYVEERDLKRTVGINTGHVGTSDFVLEPADIEFVLERGKRSLEAFLKYYVASHRLKKRPEFRKQAPRKGSKTSLLSSDSNSSLGTSEDLTGIPCSNASASRQPGYTSHLSPIPSEGGAVGGFVYPESSVRGSEPAARPLDLAITQTQARPSGRSVSISDHVVIMTDKDARDQEGIHEADESVSAAGHDVSKEEYDFSEHSPLFETLDSGARECSGKTGPENDCEKRVAKLPDASEASSSNSPGTSGTAYVAKTGESRVEAEVHSEPSVEEDNPKTPLLESAVFENVDSH